MGDDPGVTAVLLTCGAVTARQRLAQREIGTALDWHSERSDLMARKLDKHAPAWVHRVATDGRAVADIAAEIIGLAGWAPGGCRDRAGPGAAILGPMPPAAERPITSAALAPHSAHPPERVTAGPLVLRRMEVDDAGIIAAVVGESLDHLRPWMPWATRDAADRRTQLARIAEADELWDSGTDYIYAIFAPGDSGGSSGPAGGAGGGATGDRPVSGGAAGNKPVGGGAAGNKDGALVGTIGLHRRTAEEVIEIGYWIAAGQTRRGYGTAAARAATSLAAALPGIRQVEIQCDEANVASAAIPRKLGYRLDRTEPHEPEAPGERGRRMIWIWDCDGARDGAR
jgi:RimJ/RimL family protein N-acetyltransferase